MRGNGKAFLNLYTKSVSNNSQSPLLWSRNREFDSKWNLAELSVKTYGENFQIVFEAKAFNKWLGSIALDDVYFEKGKCNSISTGSCDFDTNRLGLGCSWTNEQDLDDFDWEEGQGQTSTFGTGPSVDHTFGNKTGRYLFIGVFLFFT
jgi:hypothetical protein